jgi:hypothetical protein
MVCFFRSRSIHQVIRGDDVASVASRFPRTILIRMDAKWLPVVNFAGLAYYVAWLGAAGHAFAEAFGLFSVTLTNPQFIIKPQRRRNFL